MSQLTLMSIYFSEFDPAELNYLTALTSLQCLRLLGSTINDTHLRETAKLSQLRQLHLEESDISDQGLTHLTDLENLNVLFQMQASNI